MVLNIKKIFDSVTEAMEFSTKDFSYNLNAAKQKAKTIDKDYNVQWVGVDENDDIYYICKFDVLILNKFTPFYSLMSSDRLKKVNVVERTVIISEVCSFENTQNIRNFIGKSHMIVTQL